MALFEGTVAFVMISRGDEVDGPLARRNLAGARRRQIAHRCMKMTLPLVTARACWARRSLSLPRCWALSPPPRYWGSRAVITSSPPRSGRRRPLIPPDYGRAAAMGISLFAVMLVSLTIYRLIVRRGNYATITGKAFRPRALEIGRDRLAIVAVCWAYILVAVVLPLAALTADLVPALCHGIVDQMQFTLANYENAFGFARGQVGAGQQPDAGVWRRDVSAC